FLDMPAYLDQFSTSRIDWEQRRRREAEGKLPSLRQIVLISPIAHENIERPGYPDGTKTNANLKLYTEAMARVAKKKGVPVVDLLTPSLAAMKAADTDSVTSSLSHLHRLLIDPLARNSGPNHLTINGVHLNVYGDAVVGSLLDQALFGPYPTDFPTADF